MPALLGVQQGQGQVVAALRARAGAGVVEHFRHGKGQAPRGQTLTEPGRGQEQVQPPFGVPDALVRVLGVQLGEARQIPEELGLLAGQHAEGALLHRVHPRLEAEADQVFAARIGVRGGAEAIEGRGHVHRDVPVARVLREHGDLQAVEAQLEAQGIQPRPQRAGPARALHEVGGGDQPVRDVRELAQLSRGGVRCGEVRGERGDGVLIAQDGGEQEEAQLGGRGGAGDPGRQGAVGGEPVQEGAEPRAQGRGGHLRVRGLAVTDGVGAGEGRGEQFLEPVLLMTGRQGLDDDRQRQVRALDRAGFAHVLPPLLARGHAAGTRPRGNGVGR